MSIRPVLVVLTASFLGCGSGSTTTDTPTTTASVTSAPEGTAAPSSAASENESPRAKSTRLILKAIDDPEMANETDQRARIAAMGLTEADYGLPAGQIKAFKAVVGTEIDPSQCGVIVAYSLEETAKPDIEKKCGPLDALKKTVQKAPEASRASALMKACKITRDDLKDTSKLNPWAVLVSTVVGEELAAQPNTNADEAKVARALAGLCPPFEP